MTLSIMAFHGWGLSADFWQPLAKAMAGQAVFQCVDLGFTAPVHTPPLPERPCLALGHSLGFACALRSGHAFDGWVSINGFPRFCRGDDFPEGIDPRFVRRMKTRLAKEPREVWADFLTRCGADSSHISDVPVVRDLWTCDTLDVARLEEGLDWLLTWDERPALPPAARLCALGGGDDPIVPPAMSRASFPADCLSLHPEGGHLLPWTHPEWCAQRILSFAEHLP